MILDNIFFSILICAYEKSEKFYNSLHCISRLEYDKNYIEVVIVDNGSDNREGHEAFKESVQIMYPTLNMQILFESRKGLVYARTLAILNANYKYIVYCDEDNYFQEDYLFVASKLLMNGEYQIVGGQSINDLIESNKSLAIGRQYSDSRVLEFGEMLWGAGLVLDKTLICKLLNDGFTFSCADNRGTGEDYELNFIYQLNNRVCYYCDDLVLYHDVNIERLQKSSLTLLNKGNEKMSNMLQIYQAFYRYKHLKDWQLYRLILKTKFKRIIKVRVNFADEVLYDMFVNVKSMYLKNFKKVILS